MQCTLSRVVTAEIFGMDAPEGEERAALLRELIELTRDPSR